MLVAAGVGVGGVAATIDKGVWVVVGVKVGSGVEVGIEVDTRDIGDSLPIRLVSRQACKSASRLR